MNELKSVLISPTWWVSVVIAGILINILSSYMRNMLDAYCSKISSSWKKAAGRKKEKQDQYISSLVGDHRRQILAHHASIKRRINSVMYLAFGIFVMNVSQVVGSAIQSYSFKIFVLFIASCCYFTGWLEFKRSIIYSKEVFEAIRRETNNADTGDGASPAV